MTNLKSFTTKFFSCVSKLAAEPTSSDLVNHHVGDYQNDKPNHVQPRINININGHPLPRHIEFNGPVPPSDSGSIGPTGPGEGNNDDAGSGRGGSGGGGGSGPNGPNPGHSDDEPTIRKIIYETIQERTTEEYETIQERTTEEVQQGPIPKKIRSLGLVRKRVIFNPTPPDSDNQKPEPNVSRVINEKIPERITLEFIRDVLTRKRVCIGVARKVVVLTSNASKSDDVVEPPSSKKKELIEERHSTRVEEEQIDETRRTTRSENVFSTIKIYEDS